MQTWSRGLVLGASGEVLQERDFLLPQLRMNDVLVRLEVAAVNAIDLMFVQGLYPVVKEMPTVPGFEGAGTVVETGNGPLTWGLRGKRVGVFATESHAPGTWAHFTVVSASNCYVLRDDVSLEAGACLYVNPLTVCMFEELIALGKHRAVVLTAAASAIARMLIKVCRKNEVTCICIVSRESQRELLRQSGCEHVLVSDDSRFLSRLSTYCETLEIRCAFDAVGGELACQVFNTLQPSGILYSYSAIDSSPVLNDISVRSLIFSKKKIVGVTLFPWWEGKSAWQRAALVRKIQTDLGLYGTDIAMEFLLGDVTQALKYHRQYKSRGKVMLRMRTLYQERELPTVAVSPPGQSLTEKFIGIFRRKEEPSAAEIELNSVQGAVGQTEEDRQRFSMEFHRFWDPLRQKSAGPVPDYSASFREDQDEEDCTSFLTVKRD